MAGGKFPKWLTEGAKYAISHSTCQTKLNYKLVWRGATIQNCDIYTDCAIFRSLQAADAKCNRWENTCIYGSIIQYN